MSLQPFRNDLSVPEYLQTLQDNPGQSLELRSQIRDSWMRCDQMGLSQSIGEVPYFPDLPNDSRLLRAARPVLKELVADMGDTAVSILLTDSSARIVDRFADSHQILRKLDNAYVAPGFDYSEEATGTNGIGTALEERKLITVSGDEHYRESLRDLVCAGRPIIHPIGNRVEGILDVTSFVTEHSPLTEALVETAARHIEQRLYNMASQAEQALLKAFLQVSRRGHAPVVALSSDLVLSNPQASRLLEPSDETLLWHTVSERLLSKPEWGGNLQLACGTTLEIRARRIDDRGPTFGVVAELIPTRASKTRNMLASTSTVSRTNPVHRLPLSQPSTPIRRAQNSVDRYLKEAATTIEPTLITGEPGVGKRFAARRLHTLWETKGFLDCNLALLPDPESTLLDGLRRTAMGGQGITLRQVETLSNGAMTQLVAFLELAHQRRWPVILTGPDQPDGIAHRAYSYFRQRIGIEPLRQRVSEFEDIARTILTRVTPHGPPQRLQAATVQALSTQQWPDNIRELESVLFSAASRAKGGDIGLQHLPEGYRQTGSARSLGSLERAEYDALLDALQESQGNRSLAAKKLGVARSTLYRKVRQYGIDVNRFVLH